MGSDGASRGSARVRAPGAHVEAADAEVIRASKRINAECAASGNVRGARELLESLILGRGLQPTLVCPPPPPCAPHRAALPRINLARLRGAAR